MRIEREHTAAIVIDYQEKLMPVMDRKEKLTENASILLAGLRTLASPWCSPSSTRKGWEVRCRSSFRLPGRRTLWRRSGSAPGEDVVRSHPWIRGKKYIILCGVEAHICVLQTLIDLKAAGFVPVLAADCISSRRRSDYEMALERARQEGAILTTYEALLFELLEKAGTEESKKIQRLVK